MAIRRGEIYFVNLNPVQGREQAGQRPVLVISVDLINRLLSVDSSSGSCEVPNPQDSKIIRNLEDSLGDGRSVSRGR